MLFKFASSIFLLLIIILIAVLYKHLAFKRYYFEPFEDANNEADLQDKLQSKVNKESLKEQRTNEHKILQNSTYVSRLNDILGNKLDVVGTSISKALQNIDSHEINFTTKNDGNDEGSFNLCHKHNGSKEMCSYLPHANGNMYLRPGKENGSIALENADNIVMKSSNTNATTSKTINLLPSQVDANNEAYSGSVNICPDGAGICSHLPYVNGDTYIRPGAIGGSVHIGDQGADVEKTILHAKSNDICQNNGLCSHFPYHNIEDESDQNNGNTYIRPGGKDKWVNIGDYGNDVGGVKVNAQETMICSSQPGGQCSQFPNDEGDTIIRAGEVNKDIYLKMANNINLSAKNNYCFGAGTNKVCFDINELKKLKTIINTSVNSGVNMPTPPSSINQQLNTIYRSK